MTDNDDDHDLFIFFSLRMPSFLSFSLSPRGKKGELLED